MKLAVCAGAGAWRLLLLHGASVYHQSVVVRWRRTAVTLAQNTCSAQVKGVMNSTYLAAAAAAADITRMLTSNAPVDLYRPSSVHAPRCFDALSSSYCDC